jgi:hypothetical protein
MKSWDDFAFELEKFILPWKSWKSMDDVPERALELLRGAEAEGYPTGFGKHPQCGYFVISSGGQGPCIGYLQTQPTDVY